MKKKFILLPIAALLIYLSMSSYSEGYGAWGSTNATGAVGATGGCNCHAPSAVSSTSVTVTMYNSGGAAVTSYIPGNTYKLKITGVNNSSTVTNLSHFGFQLCVVKSSGAGTSGASNAGSMTGVAPTNTHYFTMSSGIQLFEHYSSTGPFGTSAAILNASGSSGGTGTVYADSINWTAPTAGTGSVVMYGLINAVNHNGTDDAGDLWNTASPVTICEAPSGITGTAVVCPGATTTLSDATSGGTWSTVGGTGAVSLSGSGTSITVTGVTAGSATVSYITGCGGVATAVTVNAAPSPVTVAGGGLTAVCLGSSSLTLTSVATGGGAWSATGGTGSVSLASSGSATTVTGVSTGTAFVSYTAAVGGCTASTTVNVNPSPTISGSSFLCQGTNTTLTATPSGGSWASSVTSVAVIGSSSGLLTATGPGTTVVTYTSTSGCSKTLTVTVNAAPAFTTVGSSFSLCQGAATTLNTTPAGGTWTSVSPGTATVGSSTGIATGIAGGSSVISYTLPVTGCTTTTTANVIPAPLAITSGSGSFNVCTGSTITLSDASGAGTWSSITPSVATINSSGVVTGVATSGGTSLISFTFSATGCSSSATVTVNALPSAISGSPSLCAGVTSAYSDVTPSGTWSVTSGSAAFGTIDGSGNLTTIAPGQDTIVYTSGGGCATSTIVTVNAGPAVSAISGTLNVCTSSSTTLTDATPGGTWSTSSALITLGTSGAVTAGGIAGVAPVSYTVSGGTGCPTTVTAGVTVNALPAIAGLGAAVCQGSSTTLTVSGAGIGGAYLWSPTTGLTCSTCASTAANPSVTVTYTVTGTTAAGCSSRANITLTVNPVPTAITGPSSVCVSSTVTLNSTPAGGTWTSSNSLQASVGSASGIVGGVNSGIPNISYTLPGGCRVVRAETVNSLPTAIAGTMSVCSGQTTALTSGPVGGTWSSGGAGFGSVSTTGVVTGLSAGIEVISYTLSTSCSQTASVTVNASPSAISGSNTVCAGATTALTSGPSGGTWTSSDVARATVGSASGIVTGVASGGIAPTITYTLGSCRATRVETVNALPAIITGIMNVCAGSTRVLSDLSAGGAWSSNSTGTAIIGSSGILTGMAAGVTTISYALPSGCYQVASFTVNAVPTAVLGTTHVCVGQTTSLSDGITGGVWTSGSTGLATIGSSSGIASGLVGGTLTITYTLPGNCSITTPLTVNSISAISGLSSLCAGSSTPLSATPTGGTWLSDNTGVATITSGGVMTGVTSGTATISYTTTAGCLATSAVTVISSPPPIGGTLHVCVGSTTTLTDPGGGTWTSSATSVATIGSTGVVSGLVAGTSNISYSLGTGCTVGAVVTVNSNPAAIGGVASVCQGATTNLTDGTPGGTWSTVSANASVSGTTTTGVVTGITAGTAVISYTSAAGCPATKTVTVNAAPSTITGSLSICLGGTGILTSLPTGGSWVSGASGTVSINPTTGVIAGIAIGTAPVTYTLPVTGCKTSATVTVNSLPAVITGTMNVCAGATTTLSDVTPGGTWASGSAGTATIGSSGIVNGIVAGTSTITYTALTGCTRFAIVTVNPLPTIPPIGGTPTVCTGNTRLLTDGTPGGVWSTGGAGLATIGSTGLVTGVTSGAENITYTVSTTAGCTNFIATTVTVNTSPAAITGTLPVCAGQTTSLADVTGSGTWSSGAAGTASVGSSSGIVSGIVAGSATISYTVANGCAATAVVTVNALPSPIAGITHVCVGAATTLTDGGGGTWTSSSAIASVGSSSGIVIGITAGLDTIRYSLPTGCAVTTPLTVNPLPFAGTITGASSVCAAAAITLSDATSGGVWSSAATSVATVGSTGIVTGVAGGADTIKYAVTNICGTNTATHPITVNPLAVAGAITGSSLVCVGSPVTLADVAAGGSWSSSNTSIATVGSGTGTVSGIAAGNVTITYTVSNICNTDAATYVVTVNTLPSAGTITGIDSVCPGDTVTLSNSVASGSWTASNSFATVTNTGRVIGVSTGSVTISYTVTNSCGNAVATYLMSVRSLTICREGVQPQPVASDGFKLYPNPTQGAFTLEFPQVNGTVHISITDVLGKTLETRAIDGAAQKAIFRLNVVPGSYMVKVEAGGQVWHDKVVIW